jgi:hypothetical protein
MKDSTTLLIESLFSAGCVPPKALLEGDQAGI